jgi:hypothetical protein
MKSVPENVVAQLLRPTMLLRECESWLQQTFSNCLESESDPSSDVAILTSRCALVDDDEGEPRTSRPVASTEIAAIIALC